MQLLKIYNDNFSLNFDKPKEEVVSALHTYADKSKKDIFADKLFYGEQYELTKDSFKIIRKQVLFEPFIAVGQISIQLVSQNDKSKTQVVVQTTPFYKNPKYGILFLLFFFVFLMVVGILISFTFLTLLIFIAGGTIFALFFHFRFMWNKNRLRHYSYSFLHKVLD